MKKLLSILLAVCLLLSVCCLALAEESPFAGGTGTAEDPWQIATAEQLDLMHADLTAHYVLIDDIDLSGYEKVAEGKAGDYVLKCPRLPELEEIMKLKPNSYFLSCGDVDEYTRDVNHVYVNVISRTSSIRVSVMGAKYPDWYAVEVKNTGKM